MNYNSSIYLKSYKTAQQFSADTTLTRIINGSFIIPNVSYVGSENKTYYINSLAASGDTCDILVNVGSTNTIISNSDYFNLYINDNSVTPIGVVVIPTNHMVDEKARVMSLVDMSYTTPETGNISSTAETMCWGGSGTDINTLSNFNKVVTGETEGGTIGVNSYAYLPNEGGTYISSPHAPSPYLFDGTKNPLYFYNTTIGGTNFSANALSDIDGKTNTDKIIAKVTADWSGSSIDNSSATGNYPAACCTRRFHTAGTSAGDWYLPACGELGYVYAKKTSINYTLQQLANAGKTSSLVRSSMYWSSSEYSSGNAGDVNLYNGYVGNYFKNGSYYVRAFLRV